mmetsp:Transcript_35021/g.108402  ORF Transcript_35021/g.108402 Transcript_35021/m.108402 type:complete len:85 (-) Transcript_35021:1090-1344(-)
MLVEYVIHGPIRRKSGFSQLRASVITCSCGKHTRRLRKKCSPSCVDVGIERAPPKTDTFVKKKYMSESLEYDFPLEPDISVFEE